MPLTFSIPCSNVSQTGTCPLYIFKYLIGVESRLGRIWMDCNYLYVPVIVNTYCFVVEIIFIDSMMYVYNSNHGCLIQGQSQHILALTAIIVSMMTRATIIAVLDRLVVVRKEEDDIKTKSIVS